MLQKDCKVFAMKAVRTFVEKVAVKKAGSNCMGFLYEPKKPAKLRDCK